MTTKQTIIQESMADIFGGTVNVGDTVMVVTTGYSHNLSINKGKYLGYTMCGNQKRAKIEVTTECHRWYHKETKELHSWSKHGGFNPNNFELKKEPYTRISTLQRNRIATIK